MSARGTGMRHGLKGDRCSVCAAFVPDWEKRGRFGLCPECLPLDGALRACDWHRQRRVWYPLADHERGDCDSCRAVKARFVVEGRE